MQHSLIIGAVTALFLCVIAIGAHLLRGRVLLAKRLLLILGVFVLVVKVAQYVYYAALGGANYPTEFSTLTCVAFALVVFCDKKKVAYPFVTYAAFISGLVFNLMIFIGQDTFIDARQSELWLLLNVFVHDALFLGSIIMMGNFKLSIKTSWQIPVCIAVFVGWAFVAKYALGYEGTIYTTNIFDGTLFNTVFAKDYPGLTDSNFYLPVYYIVLVVSLGLSYVVLFALNQLIYKHDHSIENQYYLDKEDYQ
jgi:hypothetical protein